MSRLSLKPVAEPLGIGSWNYLSKLLSDRSSVGEMVRQGQAPPGKVSLARRLRCETPMTRQWIADHLHIGSASYISHLLRPPDREDDGATT